jgi:hypothetical protein
MSCAYPFSGASAFAANQYRLERASACAFQPDHDEPRIRPFIDIAGHADDNGANRRRIKIRGILIT